MTNYGVKIPRLFAGPSQYSCDEQESGPSTSFWYGGKRAGVPKLYDHMTALISATYDEIKLSYSMSKHKT